MTDAQVRELFSDYRDAFNGLDAAAVADFFDEPSAIVDGDRTAVFADREALRDSIGLLTSYYRSIGFVSVQTARIDVEHVSDDAAEVDVAWKMCLRSDDVVFSTRYWLVERAGVPRVASVLAHGEGRASTARGGLDS